MRRLRLDISYDGSRFNGWQVQRGRKKVLTVQHVLEAAVADMFQEKVRVVASGRTDQGVHAVKQVVHFDTTTVLSVEQIQKGLNALLPDDMSIVCVRKVDEDFHARFSARGKHYRYFIWNDPVLDVFKRFYCWHFSYPLVVTHMKKAAGVLKGTHDFSSFVVASSRKAHNVRTISRISVIKDGSLIRIDIVADGFLHNMVRIIVGTLVDIGRGRWPFQYMQDILDAADRSKAGITAPAHGLFLMNVFY